MRVTCEHCNKTLFVADARAVGYITREASETEPAAHLIVETGLGGSWLLHRCVADDRAAPE
jgi:hypothetical protein